MGGRRGTWVRPTTRLAVYLRDGLGCVYCGKDWSSVNGLTLDHVVPRVAGGTNDVSNLVTCCRACNDLKHRYEDSGYTLDKIIILLEDDTGFTGIKKRIQKTCALPLDTFRERAIVLEKKRPLWLKQLKAAADCIGTEEYVKPPEVDETIPF